MRSILVGTLLGIAAESAAYADAVMPPPLHTTARAPVAKTINLEAERKARTLETGYILLSKDVRPSVQSLLLDPSLQRIGEIPDEWFDDEALQSERVGRGIDEKFMMLVHYRVMVARNLFQRSVPPIERHVRYEAKRILETRNLWRDVSLFHGRNVLFVAHAEMIRDVKDANGQPVAEKYYREFEMKTGDTHRFGKRSLRKWLEEEVQGYDDRAMHFLRGSRNLEELLHIKAEILRLYRETPPPFTFLFDGHGTSTCLYLSGSQWLEDHGNPDNIPIVKITQEELLKAYRERLIHFPSISEGINDRDIQILLSCFSGTFMRRFAAGVPSAIPIGIASSEHDQTSYSDLEAPPGNTFCSRVLNLDRGLTRVTMGTVIRRQFACDSKLTIFIPDIDGKPMQISALSPEALNGTLATNTDAQIPVSR